MNMLNPSRRSLKAFSLIEAAIVLGVLGIVIGGIWVAASAVQQKMRINEAAAAITIIITGIQQKVSLSSYPTTPYDGTTGYTSLSSTIVPLGLVPPNLMISTTSFQLMPGSNWGIQLIGPTGYAPNSILLFGNVKDSAAASTLLSVVSMRWKSELVRAGCNNSAASESLVLVDLSNPDLIICPFDANGTRIAFYFKPGSP